QGRRMDLLIRGGGLEVMERPDVLTHENLAAMDDADGGIRGGPRSSCALSACLERSAWVFYVARGFLSSTTTHRCRPVPGDPEFGRTRPQLEPVLAARAFPRRPRWRDGVPSGRRWTA